MADWISSRCLVEARTRASLPPPYVLAPGYVSTAITAYAVVNDTEIWVSAPGIGTYSFDTSARVDPWSKAGGWELPFRGRADYFPEYGLWLGFSSRDGMLLLCSSDLRVATTRSGPRGCCTRTGRICRHRRIIGS